MGNNKNAWLRYQTLDKCFSNPGRKFFWQDLLDEINKVLQEHYGDRTRISRRQLFDDIRFMESEAGGAVPLERYKEGKRTFYRYSDKSFSFKNQPLNETELNQLQSAMHILARFQGIPQLEGLPEIILKLRKGSSFKDIAPVVGFDFNPFLKGEEHLGALFNAILYHKVMKISYQDFKSPEPYVITFHPYYLKQYNRRWFAFGYNPATDSSEWTLALDRIKSMESVSLEFRPNDTIDWEEYFEDIIGVTKPKDIPLTEIRLWFNPETAPYILTKPLHGSQKRLKHDDTGLIIELSLIPNFEFYQTVLSFGDKVKVVSPESVSSTILKNLENAVALYS